MEMHRTPSSLTTSLLLLTLFCSTLLHAFPAGDPDPDLHSRATTAKWLTYSTRSYNASASLQNTTAPESPLPPTAPSPSGPSNSQLIKHGFVAFGDSFAAGFGTGQEESQNRACRRGEFSYPKLMYKDYPNANFENLACSGATASEIYAGGTYSQVDEWQNPDRADFATLSIGGNDVGFTDILKACIIRPFGRFSSTDCDGKVNSAIATINDVTKLESDVQKLLKDILAKSSGKTFVVYVTGYPRFFNNDTEQCNGADFEFKYPQPFRASPRAALTQDLRSQMNELVDMLNAKLQDISEGFNEGGNFSPVIFVDPNKKFDGHRFCEDGIVEPDSSTQNTWFFLSGWNDVAPAAPAADSTDNSSIDDVSPEQGGTDPPPDQSMPSPQCDPTSQDDEAAFLCEISQAVSSSDQQVLQALDVKPFEGDPGDNDPSDQEDVVSFFIPTVIGKTFHPRSVGQSASRDAVYEAIVRTEAMV